MGSAACRPDYLNQTLQSLAGLRGLQGVSLYISQDGKHKGVRSLLERAAKNQSFQEPAVRHFEHWEHPRAPELGWEQVYNLWETLAPTCCMQSQPNEMGGPALTTHLMTISAALWCCPHTRERAVGAVTWG